MEIKASKRLKHEVSASVPDSTMQTVAKNVAKLFLDNDVEGDLSISQPKPSDVGIELTATASLIVNKDVCKRLLKNLEILEHHGAEAPLIILTGMGGDKINIEIVDHGEY